MSISYKLGFMKLANIRVYRVLMEKARIKYPIEYARAEEKIRGDPNLWPRDEE